MLDFKTFLQNKRNTISLVVILILLLAIPLGIYLARNTQIFSPRATETGPVSLAEGDCVKILNGEKVLTCKDVPLRLISPFEESSSSGSPSSSGQTPGSPAASSVSSPASEDKILILVTNSFNPSKIRIKRGTKVTWKNVSDKTQTINAHRGIFPEQTLAPGAEFAFIFDKKGDFKINNKETFARNTIKVMNERIPWFGDNWINRSWWDRVWRRD